MDFEKVIAQVQGTLTVMAGIQARQAEVLKGHSQWLEELQSAEQRHRRWLEEHERAMTKHDEKMLEIEEKLDALIRFVDGTHRPPPQ